jgi:hypothetical protein
MLAYLRKLTCFLGFHRYLDWAYVESLACEQQPVCERCGYFWSVKNCTVHIWNQAQC